MTTRIHIVNLGPDVVSVDTGVLYNHPPKKLYPSESDNFYVFDGQDILVKEVKPEAPKQ